MHQAPAAGEESELEEGEVAAAKPNGDILVSPFEQYFWLVGMCHIVLVYCQEVIKT